MNEDQNQKFKVYLKIFFCIIFFINLVENLNTMEKDKCVICGSETPYDKTLDVNVRQHYVEGSGQLCKKCNNEIYNTKKNQE